MNLAGLNWTPQPKLRIMVGDNKDTDTNNAVQKFENLLEFAKAI